MIKILVISDSHSLGGKVDEIISRHPDVDLKIHLGDSEKSIDWLSKRFDYFVGGNCDYFTWENKDFEEKVIDLKEARIFMCHGHLHIRSMNDPGHSLAKLAEQKKCDIALYGHLHIFFWAKYSNTYVLNPGSIRSSRNGEKESYAILKIFSKNHIECEKFHI